MTLHKPFLAEISNINIFHITQNFWVKTYKRDQWILPNILAYISGIFDGFFKAGLVPLTPASLRIDGPHILLEEGGGGGYRPPVISQTTGPISKTQTPFDSPLRELSKHGVEYDLEVTDDGTGRVKVGMFDISGLVTSASKISMLSANKAN